MKIFSPTITGSLGVLGNTILDGNLNVTGGITGSTVYSPSGSFLNLTATSASFGFIEAVTGSAVYIGESFVVVNTSSPAVRYAGIAVFDSGSSPIASASLEWDSLTDTWITQEETGNTSVIITGPTGSRGSETYTTVNKLQKGLGLNYIGDSSIIDNGTNVIFTTPIAGTSISASSGFLGDLTGTASFATSASFAPSTPAFPFTGSAVITGSLTVTGSISTNNTVSLTGTNKWINSVASNSPALGECQIIIAAGDPSINASAKVAGIFAATNGTLGVNSFQSFILGGDEHDVDGIRTGVAGGYNNNVSVGNSYIFGGSYNDITAGSNENIIVGGNNVNTTGGTGPTIGLGGTNNTISGGANNAILAGSGNTNNQSRSVVIGGQNIVATAADTVYVPNLVSSGSILTGNPSTSTALGLFSAVIGGNNNDIAATADNSAIVGGENNVINSGEINSVILGGQANIMTSARGAIIASLSSSILGDSAGVIVGGQNNTTNTGYYQGIVAGQSNTATGIQSFIGGGQSNSVSGNASVILGGTSNTNTHTNSSIIAGNGMTSRADNTAHAQNLIVTTLTTLSGSLIVSGSATITGSLRGNVRALTIASNTASLNCALDNFFTLQLVSGSNTLINPSNILPGQTINLRVNTTGSATVSFPSSVLQVSGSSYVPTTTTGVDVVTFISFDATSLLLSNVKNLV